MKKIIYPLIAGVIIDFIISLIFHTTINSIITFYLLFVLFFVSPQLLKNNTIKNKLFYFAICWFIGFCLILGFNGIANHYTIMYLVFTALILIGMRKNLAHDAFKNKEE